MGRDKLAYFNQHVGGIAILSEPEISKRSLLRSTNVRSGLQFTALKFFSMSSFLLATEVVEKSYLTTRYWLCSFVGCSPIQVPPNNSLNCVAMLLTVIVSQHGNEQTLSESARTEKNWCFVTLKQWNIVGLVHIIISLVANLCKVRHSVSTVISACGMSWSISFLLQMYDFYLLLPNKIERFCLI